MKATRGKLSRHPLQTAAAHSWKENRENTKRTLSAAISLFNYYFPKTVPSPIHKRNGMLNSQGRRLERRAALRSGKQVVWVPKPRSHQGPGTTQTHLCRFLANLLYCRLIHLNERVPVPEPRVSGKLAKLPIKGLYIRLRTPSDGDYTRDDHLAYLKRLKRIHYKPIIIPKITPGPKGQLEINAFAKELLKDRHAYDPELLGKILAATGAPYPAQPPPPAIRPSLLKKSILRRWRAPEANYRALAIEWLDLKEKFPNVHFGDLPLRPDAAAAKQLKERVRRKNLQRSFTRVRDPPSPPPPEYSEITVSEECWSWETDRYETTTHVIRDPCPVGYHLVTKTTESWNEFDDSKPIVRTTSEYVRDLTREGVESNPGPYTPAEARDVLSHVAAGLISGTLQDAERFVAFASLTGGPLRLLTQEFFERNVNRFVPDVCDEERYRLFYVPLAPSTRPVVHRTSAPTQRTVVPPAPAPSAEPVVLATIAPSKAPVATEPAPSEEPVVPLMPGTIAPSKKPVAECSAPPEGQFRVFPTHRHGCVKVEVVCETLPPFVVKFPDGIYTVLFTELTESVSVRVKSFDSPPFDVVPKLTVTMTELCGLLSSACRGVDVASAFPIHRPSGLVCPFTAHAPSIQPVEVSPSTSSAASLVPLEYLTEGPPLVVEPVISLLALDSEVCRAPARPSKSKRRSDRRKKCGEKWKAGHRPVEPILRNPMTPGFWQYPCRGQITVVGRALRPLGRPARYSWDELLTEVPSHLRTIPISPGWEATAPLGNLSAWRSRDRKRDDLSIPRCATHRTTTRFGSRRGRTWARHSGWATEQN